jgi:hypothetical protein
MMTLWVCIILFTGLIILHTSRLMLQKGVMSGPFNPDKDQLVQECQVHATMS